jgi:hypothetical protein
MPLPSDPKPKRRYHLTRAGRAALRAAIQKTKPWLRSTGPRTDAGKLATRQNAVKHGYYCRVPLPDANAFKAFVKAHRRSELGPTGPGRHPDPGPPTW